MPRTTSERVRDVLDAGGDYDPTKKLTPYIDSATLVIDRMIVCAISKGVSISDAEAEICERWLSACMYALSDKPYGSRSNLSASGQFHGQTGMGWDANLYGQNAMRLDPSGCLFAFNNRAKARGAWLGKTESEALDYTDRN